MSLLVLVLREKFRAGCFTKEFNFGLEEKSIQGCQNFNQSQSDQVFQGRLESKRRNLAFYNSKYAKNAH